VSQPFPLKSATGFLQIRFTLVILIMFFAHEFSNAQKVGLVLSGGGARGMAHIGVIKFLEENNIPIDYIAGTSAGAIVGCLYAQGYSALQMDSIVHTEEFYNWATGTIDQDYAYYFRKKEDNASWISLKFSLDSVISTSLPTNIVSSVPYDYSLLENLAAPIAKAKYDFDSLFIPFRCLAADIVNKKTVVFRKGDLAQAVRASSAYPFYFKPVVHENKILYDGGMYNNFPADIMLADFQPDIIIGSNAAGTNTPTTEGNIISQIRAMMTTPTNFSVLCENGVLIESNTNRFGLFDFSRITEIIAEGYTSAKEQYQRMCVNIQRRFMLDSLNEKRRQYRNSLPEVFVDKVTIQGVNSRQAEYVKQIIKPGVQPIPLKRLKASYFALVSDPNVKGIYPILVYNDTTGYFDLDLKIERERNFITQFGGNICSRPVSEAFVGLQYNVWDRKAYSFNGNFYFGKLYTSGQIRVRMDSPARFPYFLEADATFNQYDYFNSSNAAFFSEERPSYILKSDYNFGLNFGMPARNKGKFITSAYYVRSNDEYYQTQDFSPIDTADQSIIEGPTGSFTFERSTLNRKEYANQGTFLYGRILYANMLEHTLPGSTSSDRNEQHHYYDWWLINLKYENYFKRRERIKFGLYAEIATTDMPFFSNYISTSLNSPGFTPIQEMKTLFLPNFHAHTFGGLGSKNNIMIRNNVELILEGYVFQPYKELIQTYDSKTEYGDSFGKRYFVASMGPVFHSPLGPIGFFVNYIDGRTNEFSFLFHIGYFIFNKNAL
jgi:NTE family protein